MLNRASQLVFLALVLCLQVPTGFAENYHDEKRYLHHIPLETNGVSVASIASADTIRAMLYVSDPSVVKSRLDASSISVQSIAEDHLTLTIPRKAVLQSAPLLYEPGSYIAPSFVLDYDGESVQKVAGNLLLNDSAFDPAIDTTQLIDRWLPTKNLSRGFDIASQVATNRVGDCTEHAVLLAAVNRAIGIPARVVLGVVLVGADSQLSAFGHAWAELYIDGQWQLADAALLNLQSPPFYIPLGSLTNEGPGYNLSLMEIYIAFPKKIALEILRKLR